jgi:hypothetical protein
MVLADSESWERDVWFNLSASVLVAPGVAALLAGRDLRHFVVELSEH